MLNQTVNENNMTFWNYNTQTYGNAVKYDGTFQRRIYWDLNKAIVMMITVVTLILGVAGNIMVLLTVYIRRLMHNPMSYYLAGLTLAHTLLSLVVCPFLTLHVVRDAHYQREVCAVFYILFYSLALLVALSGVTVGLDRLWKERWRWHYLSRCSGRLALAALAVCWAAAPALVVTLELTASTQHPLRRHMCQAGDTEEQRIAAAPGDIAMEVIFYACYGVSLVCLVIVQVLKERRARKAGHLSGALTGGALVQVPGEVAEAARQASGGPPPLDGHLFEDGDQETRSVRTLGLLVGLITVCWLPFYIVYSLSAHAPAELVPYHIVEIVHYLALLSSALTPLLLYFSSVEFNMVLRQLAGAMCCRAVSIASGSTVTLEWESLERISDDQLEAFNADADRLSIGVAPSLPATPPALEGMKSDAGVSISSSVSGRSAASRGLREPAQPAGPSAEPVSLPPLAVKRYQTQRRPGDTPPLRPAEAGPGAESPPQAAPAAGAFTVVRSPAVLEPIYDGRRHRDASGGASPAGSQHSGRSHGVLAGLKHLLRRGSKGREDQSQPGSTAATPDHPERRGFAARVAALWHRRQASQRTADRRTTSEEALVRRLVAAGLPSGVAAARGRHRRQSGVWRSPGGTLHRLDPADPEYPALLARIAATDSGYRTPSGQPIHHVCARHHVHGRCHHHDMRETAAAPVAVRPQASVGTWTAPALVVEERPRPQSPHSASSTESDGENAVKRINL